MKLIETKEPISPYVRNGVTLHETGQFKEPESGAVLVNISKENGHFVLVWLVASLSIDAGIIGIVQPHEHS